MGVKVSVVARYYRLLRSTVSNIVRRAEICLSCTIAHLRRGRHRKLDSAALSRLELLLEKHRFSPMHRITAPF